MDDDYIDEFSLAGSTLRVYWFFLCHGSSPVGLRSVQRELGFSSPSSAFYQLNKLMKLGLLDKNEMGDYVVRRVAKVEFLRNFLFIKGHVFPKNALYGVVTLLVNFVCLASLLVTGLSLLAYLALLPGILSSAIFWYEAVKVWRYKQKAITSQTHATSNRIVRHIKKPRTSCSNASNYIASGPSSSLAVF